MCGICGIVASNLSLETRQYLVSAMNAQMVHRGPDGFAQVESGPCTLGHRRLAVIDTSESGAQPMVRNGVHLVFNGEFYNFQEERRNLEAEGFRFQGHSDAEVVLALYLRDGEDFLSKMRGMYALAIFDSRSGTLFCARDPLGIKPFLYAETSQGFIFASELKALLASGLVSKEVDRDSLGTLLGRGAVAQPASILRDVKWLLPGHVLTLKSGGRPRIQPFYKMHVGNLDMRMADWPEIVSEGRKIIVDCLRRQMVSDVPLGAFLSGGIDSSLLVALMKDTHGDIRTFSVGFESGLDTQSEDETNDAKEVASHLGVNHTLVVVKQKEISENLRAIARGLDHPTVDGVNSWFVARAARKDLTVAISGTGGDELFAGYPWFAAMQEFEKASLKKKLSRTLRGHGFLEAFSKQYRIFDPDGVRDLLPSIPPSPRRPDPLRGADALSRVTGLVLSGYTRDQLLADIDSSAMSHSLEVRVPFLDERVLEFALSVPGSAKIGGEDPAAPEGSYARSGVKRLLLEIARPLLPAGFERRAKRGFTLPFDGWLRGILAPSMNELLDPAAVKRRGFFAPRAVSATKDGFERGTLHWTRPWLLMMTELWAQELLDA